MTTRSRYIGNVQTFYDDGQSFETVERMAGVGFYDDFIGARGSVIPASATAGEPWVKKIVGAAPPTVGQVANASPGVVACTLTATSEKQDAALYFGDALTFDVTKGMIFEARVGYHVVPSAAQVQSVFGLQSAWIDGPDNASIYLQLEGLGDGNINIRSKDGTTTSSIASGVTPWVVDGMHVVRIDATDVTDVKFYIDGVQVSATGAIKFAATGANAILQPYCSMYKASGTGVGTLYVDVVKVWTNRS